MNLDGKKIIFLGDSITRGCGTSGRDAFFTTLLQRDCHLALARNYGIAGTRYARQKKPSAVLFFDLDFCMRAGTMRKDADIVVVFGGTNDFGHGDAPFGTDSDRTPATFCGACHFLYQELKTRYPEAVIVIIPPLHRTGEDNPLGDGSKKSPCPPLSAYVEQICRTAAQYSLPVLDLYHAGVLDPNDPQVMEEYVPDGLHPNDAGHAILAEKIREFLESL